MAGELLDGATPETNIAVVSAPSVFVAIKNILAEWPESKRPHVTLLEYDERFAVFESEFVLYDYRRPFDLPGKPQCLLRAPSRLRCQGEESVSHVC